jgi:hypothetical protein
MQRIFRQAVAVVAPRLSPNSVRRVRLPKNPLQYVELHIRARSTQPDSQTAVTEMATLEVLVLRKSAVTGTVFHKFVTYLIQAR